MSDLHQTLEQRIAFLQEELNDLKPGLVTLMESMRTATIRANSSMDSAERIGEQMVVMAEKVTLLVEAVDQCAKTVTTHRAALDEHRARIEAIERALGAAATRARTVN